MKQKITLVIGLLFVSFLSFSQTANDIHFNETKHNFGKIKQNVPATCTFTFKNKSDKSVIIETATAQCGCTKPEFSQAPILAGKDGQVKATYNAVAVGHFVKNVYVKFANIDGPVVLTIEGDVEATTAPKPAIN